MRVGKLRHLVTIQQPVEASNEYGEPETSWLIYAQVQASIEPLQGREFLASAGVRSEVTTRIRMRYVEGVTTKMRVLFGDRAFDISAVINVDERGRELQLMVVDRG